MQLNKVLPLALAALGAGDSHEKAQKGETKKGVLLVLCLFVANRGSGLALAGEEAIAAKVNGEAIYEKQLGQGLPKNAFGPSLAYLRKFKLERLVNVVQSRQFFAQNGIQIADKVVDEEIENLRKTPPPAACLCCRYETLEQFLQGNYYTLEEYREEIRNGKATDAYMEKLWSQKVGTAEAAAKLAKENRQAIEKEYIKAFHIFFNDASSVQPNQPVPPSLSADAEQEVLGRAQAAWERLKKGEAFAPLAKEVSNDKITNAKGGFLGFITRERSPFGAKATAALFLLEPGEFSQPVGSSWGYHIFRREALTDEDVLTILKVTFQTEEYEQLQAKIVEKSKVEYFGAYKRQP